MSMNGYDHERHGSGLEDPLTRTHSWPQLHAALEQVSMLAHLLPSPGACGVSCGIKGLSYAHTVRSQELPQEADSTGLVLREHSDSALSVSPAVLQRLSSSPSQVAPLSPRTLLELAGYAHCSLSDEPNSSCAGLAPREALHSKRALFGFGKAARKKKDREKKVATKGEEGAGVVARSSQDAPEG